MLYQKNAAEKLDDALFQNPTSEYRGAPFWAWNCKLSKEILLEQIEALKQMGFGGFHMHSRSGMATPYLSDEFMSLIMTCIQKAEEEDMLSWLYDEDRWPSGGADLLPKIAVTGKNFCYSRRNRKLIPFPQKKVI